MCNLGGIESTGPFYGSRFKVKLQYANRRELPTVFFTGVLFDVKKQDLFGGDFRNIRCNSYIPSRVCYLIDVINDGPF